MKLDNLDLCDVNRLTFDDLRISGKNPESPFKRLKVSKSQKQIMVSWILPKKERWGNFMY